MAQTKAVDIPDSAYGPVWTGFYVGGAFGGSVLVQNRGSSINGTTFSDQGAGGQGVLASIYGGYDLQVLPRALVGVLVEGTWSSAQSSSSTQVGTASANITSQADLGFSLLARAGIVATPSSLLYLLGGYSGQNFHTTGSAGAGPFVTSFVHDDFFNGWTIGGGYEARLAGPWSAKLEYRYTQFATRTLSNGVVESPSLHAVRVGLSYKFGGFDTAATADMPVSSPSAIGWTGPYLGVAMGAAASVTRLNASFTGASASASEGGQSVLGGAFGGYDYQASEHFVIGVLGEIDVANPQTTMSVSRGTASATVNVSPTFSWSAMARLGWLATPSTLLYAVGGYTAEGISTNGTAALGGASTSFSSYSIFSGWTVGPGVEARIAGGWSTKLEYRYSEYETRSIVPGATIQPSTHTIRLGIAYKFPVPSAQ